MNKLINKQKNSTDTYTRIRSAWERKTETVHGRAASIHHTAKCLSVSCLYYFFSANWAKKQNPNENEPVSRTSDKQQQQHRSVFPMTRNSILNRLEINQKLRQLNNNNLALNSAHIDLVVEPLNWFTLMEWRQRDKPMPLWPMYAID